MKYLNKIAYLSFIIIIVLSACRKDVITSGDIVVFPEPTVFVTSNITGTVVDEDDLPVENATVIIASNSFTTDENGYFNFKNVSLNTRGSLVKVEKQGYFYNAKFVKAELNSENFTKFKLIEKTSIGFVSSSIGGDLSTSDGATVSLSANSISDQNGNAYSGEVQVFATWLDPTDKSLVERMPGDLRAYDIDGEQVQLATFGMIGVELESPSGESLNIINGESATIELPIPADLLADAPATIPLWHFDEEVGYWVEDGEAELIGNKYVGTVNHFSFWNCDIPIEYIFIEGEVINESGGIQNLLVEITLASNATSGSDYTNEDGIFSGYIPNNEELIISIYDYCGILLYSNNIGPYDTDIILPTIVIDNNQYFITGSLACNGLPIENGYVSINSGNLNTLISANSNGNFSANISLCDIDEISVQAFDTDSATQSILQPVDITGTNQLNIGEIVVCDEAEEYVSVNLDGEDFANFTPFFNFSTNNETSIQVDSEFVLHIRFVGDDIGVYTPDFLSFNDFNNPSDSTVCFGTGCNTISIDVTEYISPGGHIKGTFIGNIPSIDGLKPIDGSFKVMTD